MVHFCDTLSMLVFLWERVCIGYKVFYKQIKKYKQMLKIFFIFKRLFLDKLYILQILRFLIFRTCFKRCSILQLKKPFEKLVFTFWCSLDFSKTFLFVENSRNYLKKMYFFSKCASWVSKMSQVYHLLIWVYSFPMRFFQKKNTSHLEVFTFLIFSFNCTTWFLKDLVICLQKYVFNKVHIFNI